MRQAILLFVTLTFCAGLALAQEAPKRKSGLWEITRTTTRTADKPRTLQMCIDEASDNALRQVAEGMRSETCKADKISRDGDKLVVDSTCKLAGNSASKTHAMVSGKFDSAYRIESRSTYDPPLHNQKEGHAVLDAKWTGPCKPDQRAGDVITPKGVKVNIYDEAPKEKTEPGPKALWNAPPRRPPANLPVPTR